MVDSSGIFIKDLGGLILIIFFFLYFFFRFNKIFNQNIIEKIFSFGYILIYIVIIK